MMLFKISAPKLDTDSRDVEAFLLPTGIQVLKSIDNIPGEGERLHVSITGYDGYPSERIIEEVIKRFFDDDGEVDAYRQPSSKPPPAFVVHLFADVPKDIDHES